MSAPVNVFAEVCLKDKEGTEEQKVLAAKPLKEYREKGGYSPGAPEVSQTAYYKTLFYLDDVLITATNNSGTIEKGILGLVDLTKSGGKYTSTNTRHHNLDEGAKPRLSKLRVKKREDNGTLREYAVLNDAGLNTMPHIYGEVLICYNNALRAKIKVTSAYYLSTKNEYSVNVMDGSRAIPITAEFSNLTGLSADEEREFISVLIFINSTSSYISSSSVTLNATVKNDEGTYESIGTKRTTRIKKTLALPETMFLFDSIPSDYNHVKSDGDTVTRYMTIEDYQKLPQVVLGSKTGAIVQPPVTPVMYKDDYLDSFYPSGSWITDRRPDADHKIKFYHFRERGEIDCYWKEPYEIPIKHISFTVGVMQYISGTSPIEGYDYKAVIRAIFVNADNPTDVALNGTLRLYSAQSSSSTTNSGITWYDKSPLARNINITLHADNTVTGATEFFFKKDTTSTLYLRMDGAARQDIYQMDYGNYALIPN